MLLRQLRQFERVFLVHAQTRIQQGAQAKGWIQMLVDIVPRNVVGAAADNGKVLGLIFFALILGAAAIRVPAERTRVLRELLEGIYELCVRVLGWVMQAGFGTNILTFICGHGPFELTAIVISTGAGLQMGWALIKTDGLTRTGSLRAQAQELGHLIIGAAVMLVIAAGIEGFWSPSSMPPPVKWAFSACACVFVTLWLALGGRGRTHEAR